MCVEGYPMTAIERMRAVELRREAERMEAHPEEDHGAAFGTCAHAFACARVAREAVAYADGWGDAEMAAWLSCGGCDEWDGR